jgi:hypothetical protein
METMNSNIQVYLDLVSELYSDIAERYDVAPRFQRAELKYIQRRCRIEGLSFLTKALPRLGKAVDTALSRGTCLCVQGFTLDDGLPKFLGWLLRLVFDDRGVELDNSSSVALMHFRQLVYLLYKLRVSYEPKQTKSVIDSFVSTDAELVNYDLACDSDPTIPKAREIISRVFQSVDPHAINPRHGPGAVATGEDVIRKSKFSRLYASLEREYSFTEYFRYGLTHTCDSLDEIAALEPLDEATAKVVLVPKDSRGPRLISAEPLEIQWIQQGLGVVLEAAICRHRWTGGYVNFTDQTINQRLALSGSKDQQWVTLDMKDASDRVSEKLVSSLFSGVPHILKCMQACRSSYTRLPSGEVIRLNKFAPMGSRLCFPVESLCFYSLILSALHVKTHLPIRKLVGRVFIFGDDIIMRRADYAVALQALPLFGLKFNESKCCTHGSFRESCGVDAHKGVVVTPVRLHSLWYHDRKTPDVYSSYVAFRNAMLGRGYHRVASMVEALLRRVYGRIPYTDRYSRSLNGSFVASAGGPALVADLAPARVLNQGMRVRFSPDHKYQVYALYSAPLKVQSRLDGWDEMLRRTQCGGAPGGVYALPRRNRLKRGWIDA